jgi:hypothetical protein
MNFQSAVKAGKKTQIFVLRVWERTEGTRYELRTPAGERTTFKTLEQMQHYLQTLELCVEEVN